MLFYVFYFLFALGFKIVYNFFLGAVLPVSVGGIYFIGTVVGAFTKQFPVQG
jgi:hypothetical protein